MRRSVTLAENAVRTQRNLPLLQGGSMLMLWRAERMGEVRVGGRLAEPSLTPSRRCLFHATAPSLYTRRKRLMKRGSADATTQQAETASPADGQGEGTDNLAGTKDPNILYDSRFSYRIKHKKAQEPELEEGSIITRQQLHSLLQTSTPPTLLDVREKGLSLLEPPIEGALQISAQEIEKLLSLSESVWDQKYGLTKPKKEQHLVVYCAPETANQGKQVATLMKELGYSNVQFLEGGIREWQKYYGDHHQAASGAAAGSEK
ncbi:hypothetical protein QOT17_005715 [Balamuthia mandrillaris]